MPRVIAGFGLDLALRHGALVYAKWRIKGSRVKLIKQKVMFEWKPKKKKGKYEWHGEEGIGQNASTQEMQSLALQILRVMKSEKIPRSCIAVDWDPLSAYWGNKRQAVTLAFLCGYLTKTLESLGYPVIFITPNQVRERLEVGRRADKDLVWAIFPEVKKDKQSEDIKDSLILAYLAGRGVDGLTNSKPTSIHSRKAKRKNAKRSQRAA